MDSNRVLLQAANAPVTIALETVEMLAFEAGDRDKVGEHVCFGQVRKDDSRIKGSGNTAGRHMVRATLAWLNREQDGTVRCAAVGCDATIGKGSHRAHVVPERDGGCYCAANVVLTCAAHNDAVEHGKALRPDYRMSRVMLDPNATGYVRKALGL